MYPTIATAIMHERVRELAATATAARRAKQARRARRGTARRASTRHV